MSILIFEEDTGKRCKLEKILRQIYENNKNMQIHLIQDEESALKYMEKEYIDAAFISWEDKLGHGLFLAGKLKRRNRRLDIVVLSEKPQFLDEFWRWHLTGYISGEVTREKVLDELENLRYA